tara:strand:- start:159 stop:2675 length:2517 start_codon:yes stop_codon:yes gene_type:complete
MRTITLQDKVSSPNTELRLIVDEEEGGVERWREYRAPKLPPRRTQGALTVSEQDPLVDFTWAQDDWSGGALRPYYREGDTRYALAKGMDARWEGVLSLGMAQSAPLDYLIQGMGAEGPDGRDLGKWTSVGSAVTLTQESTIVNDDDGSYSYKFTATTSDGSASYVKQSLENATLYQGRTITVGIWMYVTTIGSDHNPTVSIYDGQGDPTVTHATAINSVSGYGTGGWHFTSVEREIDDSANEVTIYIGDSTNANGETALVYYFDSITIEVDGSGDEVCVGMATHNNITYHAQGQVVSKWDENRDCWDAVYIHTSTDATDIVHFDNNIYVAFGYSVAYIYGATTSWTVSTLSSASKYAKYFAVARNNAGNLALWKSETVNTLKSATSAINGGSFSSAYTVGSEDRPITGLFATFDTIMIGKQDGLWQYNRTYAGTSTAENAFAPVSTEWDKGVHPDNFAIGTEWHGFFYTTASAQSIIRWAPGQIQDITSLFVAPRLPGYGGEIRALVASPHELWVAADIPESAEAGIFGDFPMNIGGASTKSIKIISLRMSADGQFNVHTIDEVKFGEVDALHVYYDSATDSRYLVVAGRTTGGGTERDHARSYRWTLPTRSAAPYVDAGITVASTGTFDTSIWHGGVPGTNKAFLKAVFWVENIGGAGSETVKVQYGLDGEDSETFTLGTLSATDRIQTLYFDDAIVTGGSAINPLTQATGRSIQLRLTLTTTAPEDKDRPKIFAFEVHSTLRPPKLKTWELFVRVGEDMIQETGYYDPVSKTKQLTDLDTLEDQVYPIYFKHTYDGHAGFDEESSTSAQIVDRERVSVGDEFEIHRLILQETDTSA